MIHKKSYLLLIILALGIIDSAYLTYVHFAPKALYCPSINAAIDCENVVTSSFSNVFGIPLAVLGLVWFCASMIFLLLGYNKIIKNLWMIAGLGGIMYSIAAQSLLHKICVYCVTLDILIAISVALFIYIDRK